MLMQNFGATNKEHYGMLWYFQEWPGGGGKTIKMRRRRRRRENNKNEEEEEGKQ